jgi:Protein of unknown function (DUF2569)
LEAAFARRSLAGALCGLATNEQQAIESPESNVSNDVAESVSCPACGKLATPGQRFCFCGQNLHAAPEAPPPQGVGGWLLYFCVQLFFLNPLLIGWQVVSELRTLDAHDQLRTLIGPMVSLDNAARIALALLGIGVGVFLVLRRRGAVAITRMYLIGFALVHLALVFLPFLFGFPAELRNTLVGTLFYRAGLTVPATTFWVLYFKHSKRVKATYGGDHSEGRAA